MSWREIIENWATRSHPIRALLLLIAVAVLVVEFVPARIAAALLGIILAICISYSLLPRARHAVQIAILWAAIVVTADASYARLNDQAPLTLVNALTKIVDAIFKLAFPLIRGLGLAAADPRHKVVAVAPDFVWALILSLIVLMSLAFAFPSRRR
jgi:hypothetical protein